MTLLLKFGVLNALVNNRVSLYAYLLPCNPKLGTINKILQFFTLIRILHRIKIIYIYIHIGDHFI